jgi:hypothetical protein
MATQLAAPVCCMPWHVRDAFCAEPVEGRVCRYCDKPIAAPISAKGKPVACIYCGMDRGFIPPIEVEP